VTYFLQRIGEQESAVAFHRRAVLRIGRGTNADLRLDDPTVELEHAVIRHDADGYLLTDTSRTGVYVDDRRVREHRLRHEERIGIGGYSLEVQLQNPQNPLYLLIHRIAEEPEEATSATMLRGDLLALAEAEARRIEEAAKSGEPADVTAPTLPVMRAPRPAGTPREAVPEEPAPEEAAPPAAAPAPARPRGEEVSLPAIDYARAYRLERRGLGKGAVTALLTALTVFILLVLVGAGRRQMWSPGALADAHRPSIGASCGKCHAGWRPVADAACAECHGAGEAGDHQPVEVVAAPPCTDCHLEHRGGDALRLVAAGGCVDCHGRLGEAAAVPSRFELRIVDFAPGDHPEFTLPASDPGGLLGFSHARHLTGLPPDHHLECADCHRPDEDGEMLPVSFEEPCRSCHNLTFDPRLGDRQAPHAAPEEVLTTLSGLYSQRQEILRRLTGEERRRLAGRRLTPDQQLAEVARLNAGRLIRNNCLKCHRTTPEDPTRVPVESIEVHPVEIPDRWLPHARFRHAPHRELVECEECHRDAPESARTEDLLLPGIETCFDCHRPAKAGEKELERLGRTGCVTCHGYHPEPGELRAGDSTERS